MKPIITVSGVSKQYRIGVRESYGSLRESLINVARAPLRRLAGNGTKPDETIWALRDVSFEVAPGEALGIIGRNGAGKSTLLKILSRITEPTSGVIDLYGRVGSLLEVGTGFHPELTGRENIFLNGAILGMRREEIEKKFDEIVSFAEMEKFLDTPVKRYSSGMYMRLAFAVAAHLEPEILIVDEVLAVGDAQFQKKCLDKMGDVARGGRTILFVSHNLMAIQSLCRRAIWLEGGRILEDDESGRVVSSYLQRSFSSRCEQTWDDQATAPGNDKVRLRSARVRPVDGLPSDPISIRTPFQIEFEYWNLQPGVCLDISLHIYNEQGIMALNPGTLQEHAWHGRQFPVGLFRSTCYVPGDLLNDGVYRVELLIVRDEGIVVHREDEALVFEVRDDPEMRGAWLGKWPGVFRPNLRWATELREDSSAREELRL
jgi:lipopolysaccharide transport system ATP-binding protein